MLPIFSASLSILFILLVPLSPIIVFSSSSDNSNLQKIATTITKEQSNNLIPYINHINGIKVQYPSDWQLVERGDNDYHKLNIIAEFLQPNQSNYYSPNISASHNSLRISVENYSEFANKQGINNRTGSELQNIGNHRLGAIGISCPGFDLKSYVRNATLAGSPAYEIKFDYSYLDNNKKAIEIWTVKDTKVYIIDYVAYEQVYDITVPVVQKMIESFEIT
jgi:PsbP-like protein